MCGPFLSGGLGAHDARLPKEAQHRPQTASKDGMLEVDEDTSVGLAIAKFQESIRGLAKQIASPAVEERAAQRSARSMLAKASSPQEHLRHRQVLSEACGVWKAYPHSCPCLLAEMDATTAVHGESDERIPHLVEAWATRHRVVNSSSEETPEPLDTRKVKQCCKDGFCSCTAEGRRCKRIWAALMKGVKERFRGAEESRILSSGTLFLLIHAFEDGEGHRRVPREHALVHLSLHYHRPWLPVFLMMEVERRDGDHPCIEQFVPGAEETGDVFLTAKPLLSEDDVMQFTYGVQLASYLNAELRLEVMFATLSERCTPFTASEGKVRLVFLREEPVVFWRGSAVEPADDDSALGPSAQTEETDGGADHVEEGSKSDEDYADLLLSTWTTAAEASEIGPDSESSSDTSSNASSSSSSTSSSSGGAPEVEGGQPEAARAVGAVGQPPSSEPLNAGASVEDEASRTRSRRPESYDWGPNFRLTYKPPASFQALCRYHDARCTTRCTKVGTWHPPNDEDARAAVVKGLKHWCLKAPLFASRKEHQGKRGLAGLTQSEREVTDAELNEQLARLPDP